MSRRASLFAKENPTAKRRVRFPDDLIFLDNIKENDIPAMKDMLRRASLKMDINGITESGMTPLHQAVIDGNYSAVRLLVQHGANVNAVDADNWTPLHAACSQGYSEIAKFLMQNGADKKKKTSEGERPLDLVDPSDLPLIKVMLEDNPDITDTPL